MEELFPCLEFALEPPYMQPINTSPALGKLPLELVDTIASFLPQKSLLSFALVHSQCRAVAIRYIYATVVLRASYFRVTPKEPGKPLPCSTLPTPELLSLVNIHGSPILRRLLANDEHIACLRDLRIEHYPDTANRPFFTAFVKHIWSNAKALVRINHEFYPGSPSPLPGPSWPDTLQHLDTRHICWWIIRALEAPPMRRLALQTCTQTINKLYTKELTHITHFEYLWHDWKGEIQEFNFDWIAGTFPNLTNLRIGVCNCWQDQGIPDKVYELAFSRLVSNLPFLRSITIGETGENAPSAEEAFAVSLSRSQPSIKEVRFEWRGGGVSWRRHGTLDVCPPSEKRSSHAKRPNKKPPQTCWTPDPSHADRLVWWFARFGLPEASRPEMLARWTQEGISILSERKLYDQVFAIIRDELMQETPCEWQSKGNCDCALCIY